MNYRESADFLKNSLIYQMSLGSKELYHSNVWAYLMETDCEFIHLFFPTIDFRCVAQIDVKREYHKRDITILAIKNDGSKEAYVIENKIKSLPREDQLEDYSCDIDGYRFAGGVLTGIGENVIDFASNLKLSGKWSYRDYESISDSILDNAHRSSSDIVIAHLSQIEEYCQVIKAIQAVLRQALVSGKQKLTYDCLNLGDERIRLDDVFKKLKGSNFLNYVRGEKAYFDGICKEGFKAVLNSSFHNSKATLDIRFERIKDFPTGLQVIGVQVEGSQFRIAVQMDNGEGPDSLYDRFKGIWFDDSFDRKEKPRRIFGFTTTMKPDHGKKYDKYISSNYCFIYQYFDVNESNWDYSNLLLLTKNFMKKAAEILKTT